MGIVVALLLTIIIYLIYPIGYRNINGKVSKKKGKKIALWNSIICCAIFCFFAGILTGGETIVTSFAPAVTYYFISKWILIDKNMPDEKDNDDEPTSEEKMINSIKNYQYSTIPLICISILFAIIYPIVITSQYQDKLPTSYGAKEVKLSSLDANQKVYCKQEINYFYLYLKEDNKLVVYRFKNGSRYSSYSTNKELIGWATSTELKNYFADNIFSGIPPISYVMPSAIPIGITLLTVFIIILIIVLVTIHKKAINIYYKIAKKSTDMLELKNKYQEDEISKQEYNAEKKRYLSEKVIKNNKFFDIFKFIY